MKNLVYDRQIRRDKLEKDNKKPVFKIKKANNIDLNRWLAADYPKDWTIQDKIKYLQKKLPPDQRLGRMYE